MIKLSNVIDYIEGKKGITLNKYQQRFLENMISGKTTRVGRGFGKTTLINGYCNYLKYFYDYGIYDEGADDIIQGIGPYKALGQEELPKAVASQIKCAHENEISNFENEYCVSWYEMTKDQSTL